MMLRWLPGALIGIMALTARYEAGAAPSQFTLFTNQFAGPPLVGYGAEMSPFLTAPNAGQPVGDLADLDKKLKALAPQHVRIYLLSDWWHPGNEAKRDSFVRTCQMAQAAGATINVTLWYGWQANPTQSAQDLTHVLQDLIVQRGLTAVRYVTVQNEVNSTKITMAEYNTFYRLLDRDLREAGLRDRLKIVGGDLVRNHQADWLRDLGTELAPVCDGHSVHVYWEYTQAQENIPKRMHDIAALEASLPAAGQRPLFLNEFGVRGQGWQQHGKEPGVYEDGAPIAQTPVNALQIGWLMIEATRNGFAATVEWEAYDVAYAKTPMHYGIIGEARDGWPLHPTYQVLRLFTHTIAPDWRALKLEGDSPAVALTAVQGTNGELTLMALNHTAQPQVISVGGIPSSSTFQRIAWTSTEPNQLKDEGAVAGAHPLEITLPPKSIAAFISGSDQWEKLAAGK